nr:transcriptional regulator [Devosia sp. CJK-A8-3]
MQDALLAALAAGRNDWSNAETQRWLGGTVRNRARMMTRQALRGRRRDTAWHEAMVPSASDAAVPLQLAGLPPALALVAALVLSGHNRREIAYLLGLTDTALRQRILALKRQLQARGLVAPHEMTGLSHDLAYGRIRQALGAGLSRHGGQFGSHDPDGHIFIVTPSQTVDRRQ